MNLDRYHRQMLLPGFGSEGQTRLLGSTALILGCGALGTVIANTLARAGVGHLIIADRDFIELTNLQRQVLFDEDDLENPIPKAEAAKQKLARINSQVKVTTVVNDVNYTNIETLAIQADVIIDAVDNFETRFLANDCAVKYGIPYVYGGAVGTIGMTFSVLPHTESGSAAWEKAGIATPCLRCIFEHVPPPGMHPTCDTVGVLGPIVGIIASYESAEALKILTHNWQVINTEMVHIDVWQNQFHSFQIGTAYDAGNCRCCKRREFAFLEGKVGSTTTVLCGRNAVQLSHKQAGNKINFEHIAERLGEHGMVKVNRFMLRAQITDGGDPYELTIFADGRAIVKGTNEPKTAKSMYAKYVGA